MDSSEDVPIILSQTHAEKTAQGVVAFLVEDFGLKPKTSQDGFVEQAKIYYPAYTGATTTLSIALQTLGIDYSYSFRKKVAGLLKKI